MCQTYCAFGTICNLHKLITIVEYCRLIRIEGKYPKYILRCGQTILGNLSRHEKTKLSKQRTAGFSYPWAPWDHETLDPLSHLKPTTIRKNQQTSSNIHNCRLSSIQQLDFRPWQISCSALSKVSSARSVKVKSLSGWCMDPGFKACTCKNISCKNRNILCISSMQGPLQGKNDSFMIHNG